MLLYQQQAALEEILEPEQEDSEGFPVLDEDDDQWERHTMSLDLEEDEEDWEKSRSRDHAIQTLPQLRHQFHRSGFFRC
jgi:hypothetical protein